MRHFVMGFLIATYAGTAGAQSCVQPAERSAFDFIALKSTLMVAALSCNQQSAYNKFMKRFQPGMLAEQHVMDGYFAHAYGLYSQMQEDSYVTTLANSQSEASISIGAAFCGDSVQLFKQVLALKSQNDLVKFTAANPPVQPVALNLCAPVPVTHTTIAAAASAQPVANQPPPEKPESHPKIVRAAPAPRVKKSVPVPVPVVLATVSI
jgi:hypothetical protein